MIKIFIQVPNIPESLGLYFLIYSNLSNSNRIALTRYQLQAGVLASVESNATKVLIQPLYVNAGVFEKTINLNNKQEFKASNYSEGAFRPVDTEYNPLPFRKEIFPTPTVEDLKESVVGDDIWLDFFDIGMGLTVTSNFQDIDGSWIKTAVKSYDQDTGAPMEFLQIKTALDNSISIEIYNFNNKSSFKVYKEQNATEYTIEEWASSDFISIS